MPKLRRMSGSEIVKIFAIFGFSIFSQRGSHIKLRRVTESGEKESLTIPNHPQLDTGTCRAILRQASRYIPVGELKPHFYTD